MSFFVQGRLGREVRALLFCPPTPSQKEEKKKSNQKIGGTFGCFADFSYFCSQKSIKKNIMATITFNRERFLQSIREYRQQKREWQERINKQLDEKEEEIRRIKASGYYELA